MKKRHWLDLAEYASLVGLGIGSVASFLSTLSVQFLYTSAPLSFLLLLNLANRRRLEQLGEQRTDIAFAELDRRLIQHLQALHQHILTLPTVEAMGSMRRSLLTKNREVVEKLSNDITNIQQELQQRLAVLEEQNLGSIRPEIRQIREQYGHLFDSVAQISTQLQRLSSSTKVEGLEGAIAQIRSEVTQLQHHLQDLGAHTRPNLVSLQDQINHVNRQFQKLPPPVNYTSLKQEVGELVKVVADLVPRREMVGLLGTVQALHHQQETLQRAIGAIESAAVGFKRQLNQVSLPMAIAEPGTRHDQSIRPLGETSVYSEVQGLVADYLEHLRSHLTTVQTQTQTLTEQQQQLRSHVHQLPQTLDIVALQRQIQTLTASMAAAERNSQTQIREILEREFHDVNQQLGAFPLSPQYEFIVDAESSKAASASRVVLESALEQTQERLILIYPWSNQCPLDHALMQQLETFLRRNKRLDLGWCHQADPTADRFLSSIYRGWAMPQSTLQNTLHHLLLLKRRYSDRFHFKVLGTGENFLVSDQSFAVLGIYGTLTTQTALPEMQLKLRTDDPNIVQPLIQRFEQPVLDPSDRAAHWNRAVTRDDLGDKAGAIADYTHILTLEPDQAIIYTYRGVARYDQGDRAGAIADFSESIRLNPHQAMAFCNRGFIRAEAEDLDGAIADYSRAIQQQPGAIAHFYRGMAYQKLGNYQAAEIDYSEAICLEPDTAVARYYRGMIYQKLEHYPEAIADLEIAAKRFVERGNKTNAQRAVRAWRRSCDLDASSSKVRYSDDSLPQTGDTQLATGENGNIQQNHLDLNGHTGKGHMGEGSSHLHFIPTIGNACSPNGL